MYQNIYISRSKKSVEAHIWDDEVGYKKIIHKPYAYKKSSTGTYQSLYGDKLKKVNFWPQEEIDDGSIFESDVPVETRVLVDTYNESDEPSKGHKTMIFDIEVEITEGFPDIKKADNVITAIGFNDPTTDE